MKSLQERGPGLNAFPNEQAYRDWLEVQKKSFGPKLTIATVSTAELENFRARAFKIAVHNLELCGIDLDEDSVEW